jgi:hypothetical protein
MAERLRNPHPGDLLLEDYLWEKTPGYQAAVAERWQDPFPVVQEPTHPASGEAA